MVGNTELGMSGLQIPDLDWLLQEMKCGKGWEAAFVSQTFQIEGIKISKLALQCVLNKY